MPAFDWHRDPIDAATPLDRHYRNTQNVRRFFLDACGPDFAFDRAFMAYLKDGTPKTMGEAAQAWICRTRPAADVPLPDTLPPDIPPTDPSMKATDRGAGA